MLCSRAKAGVGWAGGAPTGDQPLLTTLWAQLCLAEAGSLTKGPFSSLVATDLSVQSVGPHGGLQRGGEEPSAPNPGLSRSLPAPLGLRL